MRIKYRVVAIKRDRSTTHEQTFLTAAAAFKARAYLQAKGYIAEVRTALEGA